MHLNDYLISFHWPSTMYKKFYRFKDFSRKIINMRLCVAYEPVDDLISWGGGVN